MSALEAGAKAPDIDLSTVSGHAFSLSKSLRDGPVLLVFFKISCPVCQFAMPYAERLFQSAKGKAVTVIGISQDDEKATTAFMKQYKLTLPVALDTLKSYPASNAYGLTNVPTFFLVNPSGEIEISAVGWMREEIDRMYSAIMSDSKPSPFFRAGEQVPELKFG
ncbi:MAG TPA: TlpA disulfide reductase family protein [Candidatus Koribacter sp.]|jgi:peroxiredoxin